MLAGGFLTNYMNLFALLDAQSWCRSANTSLADVPSEWEGRRPLFFPTLVLIVAFLVQNKITNPSAICLTNGRKAFVVKP